MRLLALALLAAVGLVAADERVVPIRVEQPERRAAGYYRTPSGTVYYYDGCNTCSVGDDGRLMSCTLLACLGPAVAGWENLPANVKPPGSATLELPERLAPAILGWGTPTPTPTKKPFVPPTPIPTPWWIVTPTPGPTAVPTPVATPVVTPVPDHTPVPTPASGAPIVLVLRWPQRDQVVYEAGMAKRPDGQPWQIVFDTPEAGRVPLVLVTPDMVLRQYQRAEAAANRAQDAVAGCYSLLAQVKAEQAATKKAAKPAKKMRSNR